MAFTVRILSVYSEYKAHSNVNLAVLLFFVVFPLQIILLSVSPRPHSFFLSLPSPAPPSSFLLRLLLPPLCFSLSLSLCLCLPPPPLSLSPSLSLVFSQFLIVPLSLSLSLSFSNIQMINRNNHPIDQSINRFDNLAILNLHLYISNYIRVF